MQSLRNQLNAQAISLNESFSALISQKLRKKFTNLPTKAMRWITWRFKQVASIPSQLAWAVSKIPLIEKGILYPQYQKSLKAHETKLPIIKSIDSIIVDDLESDGISFTSLESLGIPNTQEFWVQAKKLAQELKALSLLPENQGKYEILASSEQLMKHEELFHWGLNERLLNIVERYVGLPVAYDGCLFVSSIADGREIGARAWHRDRECRKMIKIGIYLNDVVNEGGPFQLVKPELNDLMCSTIKHRYKSVLNEELKTFHPQSSQVVKTCTGKAGTVFFFDPATYYHRGQPPTKFHRSAIFFSYFSRRPWHPFFCQRSPFSEEQLNQLTAQVSTHQRNCTKWKETLPWFVRLIPKSLI